MGPPGRLCRREPFVARANLPIALTAGPKGALCVADALNERVRAIR